jgi:hypothetical protein
MFNVLVCWVVVVVEFWVESLDRYGTCGGADLTSNLLEVEVGGGFCLSATIEYPTVSRLVNSTWSQMNSTWIMWEQPKIMLLLASTPPAGG